MIKLRLGGYVKNAVLRIFNLSVQEQRVIVVVWFANKKETPQHMTKLMLEIIRVFGLIIYSENSFALQKKSEDYDLLRYKKTEEY